MNFISKIWTVFIDWLASWFDDVDELSDKEAGTAKKIFNDWNDD